MYTAAFEKLPQEKQQTIINAGILCFGQYGYEKASISEIAKTAGISKAAVFLYFGTKQGMLFYLIQYARKELETLLEAVLVEDTDDYFVTMERYHQVQLQLVKKHPGMYEFMRLAEEPVETTEDFEAIAQFMDECRAHDVNVFLAHVDWTKFREDIDRTTVLNMTTWIGNGCLTQLEKTLSLDELFAELARYLGILKTMLYKPQYL